MSSYKIGQKTYSSDDTNLSAALAAVYGSPKRPLCLCKGNGIEMYIAKLGQQYVIKRMPHSGPLHATSCDSYEPPAELSGLGDVMGGAIQTNVEEGTTALKFDFALTKTGARAAPVATGAEHDSVRTDGKKLTLRGTLHYLFDEAGFTRWAPAMAGKRSWYVIRKYLLEAASDKIAKGGPVADMLYIPESFSVEKKDEIARKRTVIFNELSRSTGSTRKLKLLVGEVKEIGDARFGKKMVIKHLPDAHLMMNDDVYRRLIKRFEHELSLWAEDTTSHLMVIATFGVNGAGTASLEEASLTLTNENWLPYETKDEKALLETLIAQKRRFVKGLRYNLASTHPLASVVLSDTEKPVAMYIVPYGASDQYRKQLHDLQENSDLESWQWDSGTDMPEIPGATSASQAA